MTTYMLVYTIRNIQNEVRKKEKLVATIPLQCHTDMIY